MTPRWHRAADAFQAAPAFIFKTLARRLSRGAGCVLLAPALQSTDYQLPDPRRSTNQQEMRMFMKNLALVVYLAALPLAAFGEDVTAAGGTASFVVNTTVPGISVKGKSTALQAHATVRRGPEGLHVENVEATVPVKSILTGMAIRDEHMRRYIFTASDGTTPDLHFAGADALCTPQ